MKLCGFEVGLDRPLFLIAGPCVVESRELQMDVAGRLKEICAAIGMPFIFKSSYDKANRSSGTSFRGPGMEKGLRILADVKKEIGVPVLTDVHEAEHVPEVAAVVDVLQTPAFLCRQTDFIQAVARGGKPVNIKKGQFLAPEDMREVVRKAKAASGSDNIMVCERGASFGYHNLVSDMRSLAIMRETACPVVFDATHSVQLPGGQGPRAAADANSCRCWPARRSRPGSPACSWRRIPQPDKALSDGPNSWPLGEMRRAARNAAGARRHREARGLSRERPDGSGAHRECGAASLIAHETQKLETGEP
jgi:2-dehydro-3-deoxyphosphooctonate aldolase (KDO 8-P synthase)